MVRSAVALVGPVAFWVHKVTSGYYLDLRMACPADDALGAAVDMACRGAPRTDCGSGTVAVGQDAEMSSLEQPWLFVGLARLNRKPALQDGPGTATESNPDKQPAVQLIAQDGDLLSNLDDKVQVGAKPQYVCKLLGVHTPCLAILGWGVHSWGR